jgi:hypothetical protein
MRRSSRKPRKHHGSGKRPCQAQVLRVGEDGAASSTSGKPPSGYISAANGREAHLLPFIPNENDSAEWESVARGRGLKRWTTCCSGRFLVCKYTFIP